MKNPIIKTIDTILDESFLAKEGGILIFKKKITGLNETKPSQKYLQKNPMAQYLIKHLSDALIHVATGCEDFNPDIYVIGARFGISDDVAVRLSINAYEDGDQPKMLSDRLGDIYAGMYGDGFGDPFFHERNFREITRFLKENLLGYLAALRANQKKLPLTPRQITHQRSI